MSANMKSVPPLVMSIIPSHLSDLVIEIMLVIRNLVPTPATCQIWCNKYESVLFCFLRQSCGFKYQVLLDAALFRKGQEEAMSCLESQPVEAPFLEGRYCTLMSECVLLRNRFLLGILQEPNRNLVISLISIGTVTSIIIHRSCIYIVSDHSS